MRLNTAQASRPTTHEGAPAKRIDAMAQLRRSVCSALLWESEFYEDGVEVADRVTDLAARIPLEDLAALARELRETHKLRHMPLLLLAALARHGSGRTLVADTIADVIRRPDEMGELLSIHARLNDTGPDALKGKVPAQMLKGVGRAFTKFDAYQLGKYDRRAAVRLRDVLRLTHPSPKDAEQSRTWKALLDGTLESPDTWEVSLSAGGDKRETFDRLLREGRLGYLALLRNLRGMVEAGVDEGLIRDAVLARKGAGNVLPFRYVAAARACPRMEPVLDQALCEAVLDAAPFDGKTMILVDVSYSMRAPLSARSDLDRMTAAATLASIFHGDRRVASFSQKNVEVAPRMGMAGVDAILGSQHHSGTRMGEAVKWANKQPHDRLVVITDEQSRSPVPDPVCDRAYMINVASARNGVGYGRWTHIDGFSESVLRFMREHEALAETSDAA